MILKLCFVFCAIFSVLEAKNEEYKGFKIYNVKFVTQQQQNQLSELKNDSIDFLRNPSLKHNIVGRAMVPPSQFEWFEGQLQKLGVETDIAVDDVYEHLTNIEKTFVKTAGNDPSRAFDFLGYHRYDVILEHLRTLAALVSGSAITVTIEEFGLTEQNRPIVYLRISENTVSDVVKPIVIVEAGINPREWITVPSSLNIVNRLAVNENNLLSRADWIIIPVLNPDGYEYTHTNDRLWTKNRSTRSHLGPICPGANLNRNFDMSWLTEGSSSSPCSHLFAGVQPFSEIETQLVRSLIEEYFARIRLYVSLQNNGGFVAYPWMFERAASGMFIQHLLLGNEMVAAMDDEYRLDVGWQALGDRASGTSADYVQNTGVLFSYTIDVVQRGPDGFNIPEDQIIDVIADVWIAVSVAADALL